MDKKTNKKFLALIISLMLTFSVIPFSGLTVFAASKTYYVAVDGTTSNNGLSAESPITLAKINTITLNAGDTVLFKRGDVFYGNFTPKLPWNFSATANTARIVVDAYGEGDLPQLSLAKIAGNNWTNCNNGFWKYDLSNEANYTGVSNSFLDDTNYANVGFFEDINGNIYGVRKANADACTEPFNFYCDTTHIYVKSDGNPYYALGELTMAVHGALIETERCMTFSNLHLKYAGYGFGGTKSSYVTIQNCIIEYLGGVDIDSSETFTRGGNGVELYNLGNTVIVTNNIFRQIYDVAFTCQGNDSTNILGETVSAKWDNVTVTNNIIAYCTQAFEIWCGGTSENSGITNLNFTNNFCIGQGEGWTASFRSTAKNHSVADILTYGYTAPLLQMNLTGNTYIHLEENPAFFAINLGTADKFFDTENYGVVSNNNHYYHLSENSTAFLTNSNLTGVNFAGYQAKGQDTDSTFTAIGDNLDNFKALETIALSSYNFNDIADAAKDAYLEFNLDYDTALTTTDKLEDNISLSDAITGGTVEFDATLQGDYCTVTVTVAPDSGKILKADGLKYTYSGNTYPIVTRVGAANPDGSFNKDSENQCTVFEFNIKNDAENVVISADFVDRGTENIAVIGTSVNSNSYKLRFRSRAASTYIENGVKYTIESCGTLLFKEAQTDLSVAYEDVAYGRVVGKNVKALNLYDRCDDYYEYVCHIDYGSSDSEYLDDVYYAYAYATYRANNGSKIIVFSTEDVAHSYSEVAAIANDLIA